MTSDGVLGQDPVLAAKLFHERMAVPMDPSNHSAQAPYRGNLAATRGEVERELHRVRDALAKFDPATDPEILRSRRTTLLAAIAVVVGALFAGLVVARYNRSCGISLHRVASNVSVKVPQEARS